MLPNVAALVSFPVAVIKCPTAPQGRRCLFQPIVQGYSPILSGRLRQQHRLEEAGHIPSTTRKRRVTDACCCSAPFSPKQSRVQPGNGVAQSKWVPTSDKTIEILSHRHTQRPISRVILTVNTDYLSGLTQVPSFFGLYPMKVHLFSLFGL